MILHKHKVTKLDQVDKSYKFRINLFRIKTIEPINPEAMIIFIIELYSLLLSSYPDLIYNLQSNSILHIITDTELANTSPGTPR